MSESIVAMSPVTNPVTPTDLVVSLPNGERVRFMKFEYESPRTSVRVRFMKSEYESPRTSVSLVTAGGGVGVSTVGCGGSEVVPVVEEVLDVEVVPLPPGIEVDVEVPFVPPEPEVVPLVVPSSTPHWSNESMPQITPATATLCS